MTVDALITNVGLILIAAPLVAGVVFFCAGCWKAYEKAGREGWEAIVPVWNLYAMCKIGGMSGWWLLALLAPLVNLFAYVYVSMRVAKRFGKDPFFGVGLAIFGVFLWALLGFGKAEHTGSRGLNFQ